MTYEEFAKSLNEEQREFLKSQLKFMLGAIGFQILLVESLKEEDDYKFLKYQGCKSLLRIVRRE